MRLNIIGAGMLGQVLGKSLVSLNLITVLGIVNRSMESANRAIDWIGQGRGYATISELPHAELIFISTNDSQIEAASRALASNPNLKPGDIVVHFSGALNSDCLRHLSELGVLVLSAHPLHSFKRTALSLETLKNSYMVVEGDISALEKITALFQALGLTVICIDKTEKATYHMAGVFASNYMVTLAGLAETYLLKAGISKNIILPMITQLMQSTLMNLKNSATASDALTGPIMRGDLNTIKTHMNALTATQHRDLYAMLGKETLKLTTLDADIKQKIDEVLS